MNYEDYNNVFISGFDNKKNHQIAIKRYKNRRKKLAQKNKGPIIISGRPIEKTVNHWFMAEQTINQDPLFFHLTGINQPGCFLYLNQTKDLYQEILFLYPFDTDFEFWNGKRLSSKTKETISIAKTITGFDDIRSEKNLFKFIKNDFSSLPKNKIQYSTFWHEKKTNTTQKKEQEVYKDFHFTLKNKLQKQLKKFNGKIYNLSKKAYQQRLSLDKIDIINTTKANKLTGEAFCQSLTYLKKAKNEFEFSGFLNGELQKRTPFGQSFSTICASGKNATYLHYTKNNKHLKQGELLLLDFGLRWQSMHADISRTIPINGHFNPLQKSLYQIVLQAQKLVEKNAIVGVTIKHLNEIAYELINTKLEKLFKNADGEYKLKYKKAPHGVSHLIGETVHDGSIYGEYKNEKMRENWLISNEPGLYGEFILNKKGITYHEDIGIRIEDNLLIKKNKSINLSKSIPKTINKIENLLKNQF